MTQPRHLVVIGDSLAFTDDTGPKLPDDSRLFPAIVRDLLANATGEPWTVTVIARAGADVRETWRTLTKDRHVQFDVLPGSDAVIVAIGSFDHAPGAIPPAIEALVPYLHPPRLRRWVRRRLHRLYPIIAGRLRITRTPRAVFARRFDVILRQIRGLSQGAAGVVMGPTSHRARYFGDAGGRHPKRQDRERLQFDIAQRHGFATVACWPLVERFADRLNPDGIHWPPSAHAAVAGALAAPLLEQLDGTRSRPSWYDDASP